MSGYYLVELNKNGKSSYQANLEKETIHSKQEIDDYCSRGTLLSIKNENEFSELKVFIEEVELVRKIQSTLETLYSVGHFNYREYEKKFASVPKQLNGRLEKLKESLQKVQSDLSEFNSEMENLRSKNPLMNYVQGQNIWLILDFLNNKLDNNSENNFKSLLEFIDLHLSQHVFQLPKKLFNRFLPPSLKSCSGSFFFFLFHIFNSF